MIDVPNVLNQPTDDPRLLLSEPFRAVHFVFGLFHPDVRPLSGRALLGSLSALGFRDEAARGILLRLRRAGFLESRRTGREAVYTVSARSLALLGEMASRSTQPPPPWDGEFRTLLVHIPTGERAYREQLRRHAAYAGFGSPLPGLLIAPYSSALVPLEPLLARRPRGALITRGRLAVDRADAAGLTRRAWDLDGLAAVIATEAARMRAAAETAEAADAISPLDAQQALRLLWRSIGPLFEVISANPPLPSVLLPKDWPMERARTAFFRVAAAVAVRARKHIEDLDGGRPLVA